MLPGAPRNADVIYLVETQGELTWDASVSPVFDIVSYDVFYKESTTPDYPALPQITRFDSLPSYSEFITVIPDVEYDFIVRANAVSGKVSTENCDSCEVLNSKACGDGIIITGEICDGAALNGAVCEDFGYPAGVVACDATCNYDTSSCYSPSGGGTPVDEDTIAPTAGTAVSPEYASSVPITVTYSGASDTGGSGLNYVILLHKKGTGSWLSSGLISSGSSGSFDFDPGVSNPNDIYYFDLQAFDGDGNASPYPSGTGDTSTTFDTELPSIETITVPTTAPELPMVIDYENAADLGPSGLSHVELWYKVGEEGVWTDSGLTNANSSDSFDFSPTEGSANYYIDLIALDNAGNQSLETDESLTPVLHDIDPPIFSTVTVDATVVGGPITMAYEGAVDVGPAGLADVTLWYKLNAEGTWTDTGLIETGEDGSFDFIPTALAGTYYFSLVLEDNLGNRTEEPTGGGFISVVYEAAPFAAELSNLPAQTTDETFTNISVLGDGITAYRYKLDSDEYGEEIDIAQTIDHQDLAPGSHTLDVIGKNTLNQWQDVSNPTSHTWQVVEAPVAVLSNLPAATTELTSTNITVGGDNVVAYRYSIDLGAYETESPVATTINLTDLPVGIHTIDVLSRNSLNIWQPSESPTTYTWEITAPEEEVADEGEGDDDEGEAPHCENLVQDADEEGVDCGGVDCTACEEEVADEGEGDDEEGEDEEGEEDDEEVTSDGPDYDPLHCENYVVDADEEGPDCGGGDCDACIDVLFQIRAIPMGRMPGDYETMGFLNLYSPVSGVLIKSSEINIESDGTVDSLVTDIPVSDYHIGIKGSGYLQKIIREIVLELTTTTATLDFSLGGTFLLIGGDVFNDNIINSFDLALLLNNYLQVEDYLDLNLDGLVNAADLATILSRYQLRGDSP